VGDGQAAVGEYEAVVKADPANLIAPNNLAWLYLESGECQGAERRGIRLSDSLPIAPRSSILWLGDGQAGG